MSGTMRSPSGLRGYGAVGVALVGVALAACLAVPPRSGAQAREASLRQGLSLASLGAALAAASLEVRSIDVPSQQSEPVRIAIAGAAQPGGARSRVVALLDVRVLASAADAAAWATDRAAHASSAAELAARGDGTWTDAAAGPASMAVGARANVAYAVRAIEGASDAAHVAAIARAAVDAAPAGAPRTRAIARPSVPEDLAIGALAPVQVPTELAAARVIASGAGYARRGPRGWIVERTGAGDLDVRVLGVDALARFVASE